MNLTRFRHTAGALFLALIFLAMPAGVFGQLVINTIAGTGMPAYGGDGGPSTAAILNNPYGVAVDNIGNILIADYANNRIRKIDTFGNIFTIAGTGFSGFSGDGGPATAAKIYAPRGITTDAAGNVFFSDYANCRVRKISTTGIITTVAGNGTPGFAGDGTPATGAELNFPWGVTLDAAGNLYIADCMNCRVRKVNLSGTITTVGGTGIAFFSGDGGPAISAGIQYPMGIVSDGPGNLYICDDGDCRIRKINTSGIISTVAGMGLGGFTGDGGPATSAKLNYPQGIARDATGNLYICDLTNNRIRMVNTSGIINTITGDGTGAFAGDGGPPALAEINQSTGVAVGLAGQIYICDNDNNRIRIIHVLSHAPYFIKGDHLTITSCPTEDIPIDTALVVFDVDTGQTETWSMIVPPLHGSVTGSYTTLSTGGNLTPSGFMYIQGPGYTGLDSFRMRITDGTNSDTITIIVNTLPLPFAGTVTGLDSLCPGDTLHFADTASGGTWSIANPSRASVSGTGLVTGISAGSTFVIYTVTNICGTATSSHPVLVSSHCNTGVNKQTVAEFKKFELYPNPSGGSFSVNFEDAENTPVVFTITDVMGRQVAVVRSRTNTLTRVQLDAPAGVYFISAETDAGRWQYKFVIAR